MSTESTSTYDELWEAWNEAARTVRQMRFEMSRWASSSPEYLAAVAEERRAWAALKAWGTTEIQRLETTGALEMPAEPAPEPAEKPLAGHGPINPHDLTEDELTAITRSVKRDYDPYWTNTQEQSNRQVRTLLERAYAAGLQQSVLEPYYAEHGWDLNEGNPYFRSEAEAEAWLDKPWVNPWTKEVPGDLTNRQRGFAIYPVEFES